MDATQARVSGRAREAREISRYLPTCLLDVAAGEASRVSAPPGWGKVSRGIAAAGRAPESVLRLADPGTLAKQVPGAGPRESEAKRPVRMRRPAGLETRLWRTRRRKYMARADWSPD